MAPAAMKPMNTKKQGDSALKTYQYREFDGVDITDARVAIGDKDLFWCENAIPVGKGALQLVPKQGAALATIANINTLWGFDLNIAGVSTPILVTIHTNGSANQINRNTGVVVNICGAGGLDADADVTIWQNSPILFVGKTVGYKSWSGAGVFAVIDATKLGIAIGVFEGRVWIVSPSSRTTTFTAPNTNNDFVLANGAGSFIITDEAFVGNITHVLSANEQLWFLSPASVEAVANVTATTTGGVTTTTFSVTNITTGLGANAPNSVIGYFRALVFMSPIGVHALSGVTPQKLSEKLDGMFPAITLGNAPAAIGTVQSLPVLSFLVTYTQSLAPSLPTPASGLATATKMLLCFTSGKWFFATQGALTWITTLVNATGTLETWGTDGATVFQIFGDTTAAAIAYKIQSKLYDYGLSTTLKSVNLFGFEYQSASPITPTITVDNELSSQTALIAGGNTVVFVNNAGAGLSFFGGGAITWVSQGMVLARTTVAQSGRYLGFTITGTDEPYRIQAIQMEIVEEGEWMGLGNQA